MRRKGTLLQLNDANGEQFQGSQQLFDFAGSKAAIKKKCCTADSRKYEDAADLHVH